MLQSRSAFQTRAKKSVELTIAIVPAGTSFPAVWQEVRIPLWPGSNLLLRPVELGPVYSSYIRCRMTASLRSTATLALRSPLRLTKPPPPGLHGGPFRDAGPDSCGATWLSIHAFRRSCN